MSDKCDRMFYGLYFGTQTPRPQVALLETIVSGILSGIGYRDLSKFSQNEIRESFSDNFWNIMRVRNPQGYLMTVTKSEFIRDIEKYNAPLIDIWNLAYKANEELLCITLVNEARCHTMLKYNTKNRESDV